jgi:hypothetical protein
MGAAFGSRRFHPAALRARRDLGLSLSDAIHAGSSKMIWPQHYHCSVSRAGTGATPVVSTRWRTCGHGAAGSTTHTLPLGSPVSSDIVGNGLKTGVHKQPRTSERLRAGPDPDETPTQAGRSTVHVPDSQTARGYDVLCGRDTKIASRKRPHIRGRHPALPFWRIRRTGGLHGTRNR